MRDIIRLLPDSVANQIAAGEVIQRPASVVKELVENAVDAGATRIEVVIVDAGKTRIQVIDNGKGMTETDARLAFERHATSKISEASDLFNLHTMGFRGEALASIAAVAQVELKTKTADEEIGTSLRIEGCHVMEQKPEACPTGANFSVSNIFFNIPARRKFLKSNQTEMSNILAEFERLALAHCDITFLLYSDDTVLLNLPAGNFRMRIKGLFGKRTDSHLLPVEVDTPLAHISGFVGNPESAKKKGVHQYFFVNGRFMRHPYFSKAVFSPYERLVAEGMQVPYFLNFSVEPSRIDVNIHPAKTEIKFQDDQAIWQIIQAAVREALGKFNAIPTLDFDTVNRPSIPAFNPDAGEVAPPRVHLNKDFNPFASEEPHTSLLHNGEAVFRAAEAAYSGTSSSRHPGEAEAGRIETDFPFDKNVFPDEEETGIFRPTVFDSLPAEERGDWDEKPEVCFQYLGRFIVSTTSAGIHFIDQHRAHVRVLFDQYFRQLSSRKGVSQGLLFPQELSLSPSELSQFRSLLPRLSDVGFDFSDNGQGQYSVIGIPTGTEGLDAASLIHSLLSDVGDCEAPAETVNTRIALLMANRAALPVGQALTVEEMAQLLSALFSGSNANYTPDGKPIQYLLPSGKMEAFFD